MQYCTTMDWDNFRYFLALARAGSIRRASAVLGVNHSTVLRRVNSFEEKLGVHLFERETTGYRLTLHGEELIRTAEEMEEAALAMDRKRFASTTELSGELRVTLPQPLAVSFMAPIIAGFCQAYPHIELSVNTSSRVLNLNRREADVALRITSSPAEHLVGRKLISYKKSVYASVDYLAQRDCNNPNELQWIGWGDSEPLPPWVAESDFSQSKISHSVNTVEVQLAMAKAGLGMTMLPCFIGDLEPTLRRVPPGRILQSHDIWLLTHSEIRTTARVRAFMQWVVKEIESCKKLLLGQQPIQDKRPENQETPKVEAV